VRKRKQIITSIVMGSAVAALSTANVHAAQPAQSDSNNTPTSDLVAQIPPAPPAPTQQPLVPNPRITIDGVTPTPGVGLQTPNMPRAVAPPVGDISVSNMDAATPQIKLDSQARINMVLKKTPAREVLESLARSANLNIAYADNADGKAKAEATISINLRNEPVQNAFNYVLQLSGLEANRIGNTIFVGARLPDAVKETIVRSLRLNQVSAAAAAKFLATQGAESGGAGAAAGAADSNVPLLLKGLLVSADDRLNSITLVGSARKIEMASSMLTRLDARRRQVALNVKIVDVNLTNADLLSNSLSFKVGDGFLSVDKGAAAYNYGGSTPASNGQVANIINGSPLSALSLPSSQTFLDYSPNANLSGQASSYSQIDPISGLPVATNLGNVPRPGFGTTANPYQPGVTSYTPATTGYAISPTTGLAVAPGGILSPAIPGVSTTLNGVTTTTAAVAAVYNTAVPTAAQYTYAIPTNYQIPSKFLSTLQAQIISGNGKILTDPTLVVQEGQKSTVNLTQDVFGGFKINSVAGTGATTSTREPIIKQAGLSLEILVNRIDDNGFVSVGVTPTVSSIGSTVSTQDGDIALLQSRTMNSGEIRLRDGQTLILSGIIQESDRTSVSKVPILGDIPILGALFRSTNKTSQRQEVVVLLTPQILNDNKGQVNYTPGADTRLLLGK
jgi:type IV pilus assembly protein PilQ